MIEHINSIAGGWWSWVAPMLWQTALLAGFVWALDLLLRRRGWPQVRYALWLLVFARLLLPPSFALPTSLSARLLALRGTHAVVVQPRATPRAAVEVAEPVEAPPAYRAPVAILPAASATPLPAMPTLSWKAWAMLACAGMSAVLFVWLAVKLRRLRRLAVRETQRAPVPEWIEEMLARVAAQFRLRRLPRIAVTDDVPSAAVCGVFRPVLFLPESSLSLPPEQMEHVLLHELAHLKRRDLLVNAAQSLLHIAYWFNPVLWLAGRRLRHLREICCDATVGTLLRERTADYSQTLMELADRALMSKVGPALGLLGLFESPSRLRQRIEYLRRPAWKYRRLRWIAAAAIAAAVVLFIVPMAAVKAESPASNENQPRATYEDMMKLSADADKMRMPTADEIKVFGALWPQVPPEENAAYYFLKAANAVSPKEAIPDGSSSSSKAYAGNAAAFQKWVELNQPAFELMRQGFEHKTCRFPMFIQRETGQPMPALASLASVRHLARTCADAGFLAELQGKPDAAAEAYADCLRLGAPLRRQGILIEYLVGIAVCNIGQRSLDQLTANSPPSEEALKKVILRCREAEVGLDEPAGMWANEWAYGEVNMKLRKDAKDGARVFEMWQKQRDAATGIIVKKTLAELLQQKTMQEISAVGASKPFEVQDPSMPALARAIDELGRADVRLKETEIRAAIALYQRTHGGALPENLDALCPDILPAVPTDPYSGKPMRYAKTPTGWKLWSVGADNSDNGGQGDPDWSKVWAGPDYVFVSNLPSNLEQRSRPRGGDARTGAAAVPAPATPKSDTQVQRREVNKPVSTFPAEADLSTPESACAAFHRASARMDAKAVLDVCWVKMDPKDMEQFWKKAAPDDLATYNKSQLDAEIVEVLIYRNDLAQVISRLKFPEGVGRDPFSARCFGRIDGKWKNLGEDRCASLEDARNNFERKKENIWAHFEKIRKAPTARETPSDSIPKEDAPPPLDKVKAELMGRVEDLFRYGGRDITAHKTLEWSDVTTDEKGNRSIRYKFLATVWDKDKVICNMIYTFDPEGKLVSVKKVEGFPQKVAAEPADTSTQAGLQKLVEKFFSQNFRDITARETIEWGEREALPNGNLSIRYKYNATIWNKDHQVMNQVFTFDPKGEFVSVKNVAGFPKPKE